MSEETKNPLRLMGIKIDAFKAVDDFSLATTNDLTLIIGPNGAGKTSLLQAIGLLRYIAAGRVEDFFSTHGWAPSAVVSHIRQKTVRGFVATVLLHEEQSGRFAQWTIGFSTTLGNVVSERVDVIKSLSLNDLDTRTEILSLNPDRLSLAKWQDIDSPPQGGSGLSAVNLAGHPDADYRGILQSIKDWAEGIRSLELLSPASIRDSMARGKVTDIGVRGEKLGAFVAGLPAEAKARIIRRLTAFYPALADLTTKAKRAGWIDFKIAEIFGGRRLSVGVEHVSDGFLRLLALAAIPEFPKTTSLVLLDEAENGIDPLILPDFLAMIAEESEAQIILTTHSPILVNRFPPEAVNLICRSEDGQTVGAALSQIPEFEKEREYQGPGEIWAHSSMEWITKVVRAAAEREHTNSEASKGKD